MIEQMRNPPVGFEEVVRTHFFLRKEAILRETQAWAESISTADASAAAAASTGAGAAYSRARFQRVFGLCFFFYLHSTNRFELFADASTVPALLLELRQELDKLQPPANYVAASATP
jgi:hypothetical protein